MKRVIIYYDFILVSIMTLIGFLKAESFAQVASAALFFPLFVFFWQFVFPKRGKAVNIIPIVPSENEILNVKLKKKSSKKKVKVAESEDNIENLEEIQDTPQGFDLDRRMFLKLIGSAGVSVFLFSLFTKKAHGAFFGSVPGPGTVALKDSGGIQIDPAQEHPTDGYKIAQLDDTSSATYAYYGFTKKGGAWFIQRETLTGGNAGDYRYTKGDSDFDNVTTGWPNRDNLSYGYFEDTFT